MAALATVVLGVLAARWKPVRRVEVKGDSMRPALEPGDRLVLVNMGGARAGDVVAFCDPRSPYRMMLKRVAARGPAGLTVLGDNRTASTDSRDFGPVPTSTVRGRAVYRYFPDSRRGPLVTWQGDVD